MSVFADGSALVTLSLDEVGHELIRSPSPLAVARLARVEVASALWRTARLGELETAEATVLSEEFEAELHGTDVSAPRSTVVVASDDVLDDAACPTAVHELRADDAMQLASALALQGVDATATRLCAGGRGRGHPQGAGAASRFPSGRDRPRLPCGVESGSCSTPGHPIPRARRWRDVRELALTETPRLRQALPSLREALVSAATEGRTLTYGEASEATARAYLPRGMGRLLELVGAYCAANGEPDLAALVVRADDHEVGDGRGDGAERAAVERRRCWRHWGGDEAERMGMAHEAAAAARGGVVQVRRAERRAAPAARAAREQAPPAVTCQDCFTVLSASGHCACS